MRHLSAEEILVIHALVIEETGGVHGVRDPHLLQSIANKPRAVFGGAHLYKSLFLKTAVLAEAVVNYHVFIDGNKRTALVVAARFLALNGYAFSATNADAEQAVLSVAMKEMTVEQLAVWIKKHAASIQANIDFLSEN